MRYLVNLPELPGRRIEVEPGIFTKARLLVDDQPAPKGPKRGQFSVRGADGHDILVVLKTSFLDPVPQVLCASRTIRLAEPLTWYQWLWTGIPILLVFRGGALGGALGGAATVFNIRILRSDMTGLLRYTLAGLLSVAAVGAYIFLAALFLSAFHGK